MNISTKKTNSQQILIALLLLTSILSCKKNSSSSAVTETNNEQTANYTITPVSHATAVIEYGDKSLYIDPVGGIEAFKDFDKADVVFITHGHGDHLSIETIMEIKSNETLFVIPQAVADSFPEELNDKLIVMKNGTRNDVLGIPVEAIAMYNIREEALQFHPKGNGNGYVLKLDNEHVYFSGDTEDTPEMRALQNIDKAFVCMNMPYTMPVEKAADAVLDFLPNEVYPYHYRGQGGFSDVGEFKRLVENGSDKVKVIQWDWYPKAD